MADMENGERRSPDHRAKTAELHRLIAAIDVAQQEADAAFAAWKTMLHSCRDGAPPDPRTRWESRARLDAAERAYVSTISAFNDARARLEGNGGVDLQALTDAAPQANAACTEAVEDHPCQCT
jgi:hypothetical protein